MPGSSDGPLDDPEDSSPLVPLRPAPGSSRGSRARPASDDAPTLITSGRATPPSDPSLGLSLGSHLGPFEILETVGVGGMAAVLKARDREMGRVVALKILPPHMARDGDSVTRFKQEARAAARLDHDNVARAFASGEDQGLHYIAFEFVEGENLRTLIERRGTIPVPECVRLMVQVAAGLAHAAERGVVHRDIKPSNLVVTPEGKAKIVDMGLARNLFQTVNGGVTQSGVTLGTFDYISPEQALDPRRADVRSDIYSLGCAFYHASTGRPPVPDGTAARKLHFHQHEPIPDPRLYNPAIPDEFAFILARMMAKDPAKRFQTAGDLIATLTHFGRQLDIPAEALAVDAASTPSGPISLLPQAPRVSRAVLIGVLAAVAGVVLVLALAGPTAPGPTLRPFDPDPVPPVVAPVAGGVLPVPPPAPPAVEPTSVNAATVEQLAAALLNPATAEIRLEPGARYDFTRLPAGLVAVGKKLLIEPRPGSIDARTGNPVIRVAAVALDPANPAAARPMALTFARPDKLTIRGVTVEIADGPPAADADSPERPSGLAVIDAGQFDLVECRFEPAGRDLSATDVVGLTVAAMPGAGPTAFAARNCYFGLRRAAAVALWGRVKAEVAECGFAPHPACFALHSFPEAAPATGTAPAGELALRSCSFLLDKGTVAEVEPGARWQMTAGYCVFAAPPPDPAVPPMLMPTDLPERRPAVLRVLADRPDGVSFRGRPGERNAYFHADPFALANRGLTFEEARLGWTPNPVADADAVELRAPPWAADPAPLLAGPRPWEAFRLNPTQPLVRAPGEVVILGVKNLPRADTRLYNPWPPAKQDATFDTRVRVVDPAAAADAGADLPRNVYPTVEAAIAAARTDDVIEIRHDGPLEVPQATIDNPRMRLTVRPYRGSAPVLVAPRDANRIDACLFRLVQGQLTLDGLDIRLKARAAKPGDVRTLAAVAVVAGRECLLRNCTVTLEEREGGGERLAAVLLQDAVGEMRPGATVAPVVNFEQTLVRGRGRAVHVAAARPFELSMRNSVVALASPVVSVEPTARVAAPGVAAGGVHLRFDQVTAVLAAPLIEFAARPRLGRSTAGPAAWAAADVTTSRCLFAPLDGSPIVRLESPDADGQPRLVKWDSKGTDWYAGVPPAGPWMEVGADPDAPPQKSLSAAEWFAFTGDTAEACLGKVRFREAPGSPRKLATVEAAQLIVETVDVPNATPSDAGAQYAAMAAPMPLTPR